MLVYTCRIRESCFILHEASLCFSYPLQYPFLGKPMDRGFIASQRVRHDFMTKQQHSAFLAVRERLFYNKMYYLKEMWKTVYECKIRKSIEDFEHMPNCFSLLLQTF